VSDIPPLPAGLLKPSRERWADFWSSPAAQRVNRESDMPRLIRWIEQTDEYDRVAKEVRQRRYVEGSQGQPVANPLINYLNQLETQISRTEVEFGMTPMARHRMRDRQSPKDESGQTAGEVPDGVTNLSERIEQKRRQAAS